MRGGGVKRGDGGSRGPFDRLRANGFWRRAFGGEWGMRWGMETPRASPLWIPAFAGMTRAEGPLRVPSGQALRVPSGQASTGSGRTDFGGAPSVGSGGAMGDGDAPRGAPALGSRESGNDDGGCGGTRWREGLVSGWEPALAGGRFANRPYDRGGAHEGGGDAGAAGGGGALREPRGDRDREVAPTDWVGVRGPTTVAFGGGAPPLWILAFAGMSRGEAFGELVAYVLQEGWVVAPLAPDTDPDV